MTNHFIEYIVICTNKKTCQFPEPEKYFEKTYAKAIDKTDTQSFFGIMYIRALYGLNNHEISTF